MQGKHQYQPKLFTVVQIESFIPKGHLLVKLDQTLDLSFVRPLTAELYSKETGRPSIDPEIFVRMLLIEYLYDIPSDRQLCEELGFNLAFRWFCRFSLEDRVPDHSSLTRIRDRLGEETFQKIFLQIVNLCAKNGLVKGKRVMTDGSYIKANAALNSLVERKSNAGTATNSDNSDGQSIDEAGVDNKEPPKTSVQQPQQASQEPQTSDTEASGKSIKGKTFSNKTHVSKTDSDSTLAGKESEAKHLRYKVHQSCDADSRVIIDCAVTTGSVPDGTVYIDRLKKIEQTFQTKIEEAIADRGYGYGENLQYLKDKGIRSFVPRFRPTDKPMYDKSKWHYDAVNDRFICLAKMNPLYPREAIDKGGLKTYRDTGSVCRHCPHRFGCFNPRGGLRISAYHTVIQSAYEMEQTTEYKERRRERMWKIEGLFAEGKFFHGLGRARYRSRAKVQIQVYLTASVQNLKRLLTAGISDLTSILVELIGIAFLKKYFEKQKYFCVAIA